MSEDDAVSLARARSDDALELIRVAGGIVAECLRADDRCFQVHAALKAGLSERRYYRLLEGESAEAELFQSLVLPAIYEQAMRLEEKAEQDIGSSENGSSAWGNWHKWKLACRHRKVFGDLAVQKVEVAGKDGGAIKGDLTITAAVVVLPAKDVVADDDG